MFQILLYSHVSLLDLKIFFFFNPSARMQSLLVLLLASLAVAIPAGDSNAVPPTPPPLPNVLKEGEACAYAANFSGPRPALGKCGPGLTCDMSMMMTDGPGICAKTESKILNEGQVCANAFQWGPPGTHAPRSSPGKCGPGLYCDLSMMAGDGPGRCAKTENRILREGQVCANAWQWRPNPVPRSSPGKCGPGLYCDKRMMMSDGPGICKKTDGGILKEGEVCANAARFGSHTGIPPPAPGKCGPGLYCDKTMMATDGPGICKPGTDTDNGDIVAPGLPGPHPM